VQIFAAIALKKTSYVLLLAGLVLTKMVLGNFSKQCAEFWEYWKEVHEYRRDVTVRGKPNT
jgi:hypothetical protein